MNKNLYSITFLDISSKLVIDSINDFEKSLLNIYYYNLDLYPERYLIESLLERYIPTEYLGDYSDDYEGSWPYTNYLYMFNSQGFIIGNIIEINYNDDNYSYINMANEIYAAIKSNAGYYNRSFYIYLADYDESFYGRLDMSPYCLRYRYYTL